MPLNFTFCPLAKLIKWFTNERAREVSDSKIWRQNMRVFAYFACINT